MALVGGSITSDGAILTVLVGVSQARRKVLQKAGLPVPEPIPVRAQLDTGSCVTGFMSSVFAALGLEPFDFISIRTPSTQPSQPCLCPRFQVSVTFVSGLTQSRLPTIYAIGSTDFQEDEEVQGILGRDILDRCVFQYFGPSQRFDLSF